MTETRAKYHVELVGGRYIEFEGDDVDLSEMTTQTPFVINANNQTIVPWLNILYIEKRKLP